MKEIERFEKLKEMGYTYDPETGEVTSHRGKIITGKNSNGYIFFGFRISGKIYTVYGHRFGYWIYHGVVPDVMDHISRIRTDNRISNLRSVSKQQNGFNRGAKGYTYNKLAKKYHAQIMLNQKNIHIGYYQTEAEARQSYLDFKKIYHII